MRRFGGWASLPGLGTREGQVFLLGGTDDFWLASVRYPCAIWLRAPTREDSR